MKKVSLFLLLAIVHVCISYSQDEVKDYEFKYGQLQINHTSKKVFQEIMEIEGVEDKEVSITKLVTQEDFDNVCSNLPWIKKLEVGRNENITDISSLAKLKSLESLNLRGLKASEEKPFDLAPLSKLTNLKKIEFYATKVTNTDALKSLVNLTYVSLYMSAVSSIDFLKSTPEVTYLSLYGFEHTFVNYEPVTGLKKLEELDIYMNKQASDENLAVLKSLTNLKKISMSNNKIATSLDFLENCHQLEEINASWCRNLEDFSALYNMKNLKTLKVSDSKLTNLDMIGETCTLENIDISGTQVTDISKLAPCTKLSSIDISETEIKDISPLYNTEKIWSLEVSPDVPQEQIDKLKSLQPKIRISVDE